jgi:hypothetical protein
MRKAHASDDSLFSHLADFDLSMLDELYPQARGAAEGWALLPAPASLARERQSGPPVATLGFGAGPVKVRQALILCRRANRGALGRGLEHVARSMRRPPAWFVNIGSPSASCHPLLLSADSTNSCPGLSPPPFPCNHTRAVFPHRSADQLPSRWCISRHCTRRY